MINSLQARQRPAASRPRFTRRAMSRGSPTPRPMPAKWLTVVPPTLHAAIPVEAQAKVVLAGIVSRMMRIRRDLPVPGRVGNGGGSERGGGGRWGLSLRPPGAPALPVKNTLFPRFTKSNTSCCLPDKTSCGASGHGDGPNSPGGGGGRTSPPASFSCSSPPRERSPARFSSPPQPPTLGRDPSGDGEGEKLRLEWALRLRNGALPRLLTALQLWLAMATRLASIACPPSVPPSVLPAPPRSCLRDMSPNLRPAHRQTARRTDVASSASAAETARGLFSFAASSAADAVDPECDAARAARTAGGLPGMGAVRPVGRWVARNAGRTLRGSTGGVEDSVRSLRRSSVSRCGRSSSGSASERSNWMPEARQRSVTRPTEAWLR